MPELIHYHAGWLNRNAFPGAHRSRYPGQGFDFREHDTLLRSGEHRRIDILATLKNPFGEIMVRRYNQRSSITLQVVADLSASMNSGAGRPRAVALASLVGCLAYSAWCHGDRFALVAGNDRLDPTLSLPAARASGRRAMSPGVWPEACFRGGASALVSAGRLLGSRRTLTFLASDFLFPETLCDRILASLSAHSLVPVVIGEGGNLLDGAGRGVVELVDSESGKRRRLYPRRAMLERMAARRDELRRRQERYFQAHGLRPLLLPDGFDADAINRYFNP